MKDDLLSAFVRDGLPGVKSSAFTITLSPDTDDSLDPKQCLEIGAMVLLDKPMLILAFPGRHVPPGLRRHADLVVELPGDLDDPESQRLLAAAMAQMVTLAKDREAPK